MLDLSPWACGVHSSGYQNEFWWGKKNDEGLDNDDIDSNQDLKDSDAIWRHKYFNYRINCELNFSAGLMAMWYLDSLHDSIADFSQMSQEAEPGLKQSDSSRQELYGAF